MAVEPGAVIKTDCRISEFTAADATVSAGATSRNVLSVISGFFLDLVKLVLCGGQPALLSLRGDQHKDREASSGRKETVMADSVYKVIELVGTSPKSWEDAAKAAVERAGKSLRDLRVAEVVQLDMQMDKGKVEAYRAKIKVSFKYEGEK